MGITYQTFPALTGFLIGIAKNDIFTIIGRLDPVSLEQ